MKKGLVFGPAGIPNSTESPMAQSGILRVHELSLGCMEVEFVRGVSMSESTAVSVGEVAAKRSISLSAHGPYFVNLNSPEEEKIRASRERILRTARVAAAFGGKSVVFHAGFRMGDPPEKVYDNVRRELVGILEQLDREKNSIWLRPETTGRESQFGTLNEILRLSTELHGIAPCIDFSHLHARTGKLNSYREFSQTLDQVGEKLGRVALDDMHLHVSGIAYGPKGERKHLNLRESDFQYAELLQALGDHDARGLVICESPNLEDDALLLQDTYRIL